MTRKEVAARALGRAKEYIANEDLVSAVYEIAQALIETQCEWSEKRQLEWVLDNSTRRFFHTFGMRDEEVAEFFLRVIKRDTWSASQAYLLTNGIQRVMDVIDQFWSTGVSNTQEGRKYQAFASLTEEIRLTKAHSVFFLYAIEDTLDVCREKETSQDEIRSLLKALHEYAIRHFDEEEMLMRRRRYPKRHEHIEEHNIFRRQLEVIFRETWIQGDPLAQLRDLCDWILSWAKAHLNDFDMSFADFLTTQPVGRMTTTTDLGPTVCA